MLHFRSLTSRLAFWTLLASGAVLLATLAISGRVGRQTALATAELEARQSADRLANRVAAVLAAVEESAQLLAATVETTRPDEALTERLLRRYVASEGDVSGAAVAYAPGAFAGRERFAPFVRGQGTDPAALDYRDLSRAGDYLAAIWYEVSARTLQPSWSEPYLDPESGAALVTYSVPFFDDASPERRLLGIATADVPLTFLDRIVAEVHSGRTGRTLVLSQAGRILALSRGGRLAVGAPALGQLSPRNRSALEPLVEHMMGRDTRFGPLVLEGRAGRVLYQPIGIADWSLGVFSPDEELMDGVRRLRRIQASLGVLGLILLAAVVILLARRLTAPLRELAAAARGLAANLEGELPSVRSHDELGALTAALAEMRDALRRYVRDLEAATAARQRLESELAIARRIQMDMLPAARTGSAEEGYQLAALLDPARAVGGDLFDHLAEDGFIFFLVADVSGKGVPAALFMARAKTLFETTAARSRAPGEILAEVNRGLCRENDAGMYVTAVCGVLETATGDLALACGGHQPPVLIGRDHPPRQLAVEGGTVLGLLEGAAYPTSRLRLAAGQTLVAFTDGVDEAFDPGDRAFGIDRLLACLSGRQAEPVAELTATVREEVRRFAGEAPQSDDITILAIRYDGPPAASREGPGRPRHEA